jgi:hypothetical protein
VDADRIMTEEEKKQREQRRRERERRHRENRDKKPVNRKLDIIDQLDATSIYGTGSAFPLLCFLLTTTDLTYMQKCSTTTALLMLLTPTETGKAAGELQCRPSPKVR